MDVIGDHGVLSLNAFNQNVQFFDDRGGRYTLVPFAAGGDPPLVRAFIDAIRHDTPPPVTGEDGLRALEVALCAYESARGTPRLPDCLARAVAPCHPERPCPRLPAGQGVRDPRCG